MQTLHKNSPKKMHNIAVLPGDGIGPEVMEAAIQVLNAVINQTETQFVFKQGLIGGAAYEQHQEHFPKNTQTLCDECDAILLGSVGGPVSQANLPKWYQCERNSLLALRQSLGFYVNIRPAKIYPALADLCPLKSHIISHGVDLIFFRELLGDCYFGEHKRWSEDLEQFASDSIDYHASQIESVSINAFEAARHRRKKVTSIDKANVLAASQLWREVVDNVAKEYPDVEYQHMLVDNCAMQLIINPGQFDVMLAPNMFGDILSDAAAVLPGSLGLMPSASLTKAGKGLYEPAGGSAPDIAGQNIANPIAQILSAAMMCRLSFQMETVAQKIEQAVSTALERGARTKDLALSGEPALSTQEMTQAIIDCL